jgi:uncharacterized protein
MMRLTRADQKTVLLANLEVADTLWTRTKGLLGRNRLEDGHGLWIKRCNNIHTFFMKFPIDLVFLNRKMMVTKTLKGVPPGRLIGPVFSASSVLELQAGFLETHPIATGETLHVDTALS